MKEDLRSVNVAGTRLAVQRQRRDGRSDGRTLAFLHDSLGCITTWRRFPQELALAAGCDALVYDRQGYGRSAPFGPQPRDARYMHREADVLHALLEAEDITAAILFGHSDGGTIALLAAAKHPERIAAVITEGAHVFVEDVTLQGIREAERLYATTDLRERLIRHHGDRTDALFEAWTKTWQAPFFRPWDITPDLASVRCPVLVLQGVNDEFGTEAQVDAIVAAIGGRARKCMVEGAAHTPHKEAPVFVLEQVERFMNEVLHRR